jgi:trans-4-hydroxy-L-proline dehydratase
MLSERGARLRRASREARPRLSSERAELVTDFHAANAGRFSPPVMRARCFLHLCGERALFLGEDELIVGERGPEPKAVPTYPELTCHSLEDLRILDSRPLTSYAVDRRCFEAYESKVIPYWQGRSLREKIFRLLPPEWHAAYQAGIFTEFMEQRAPGHTVLDGKIYRRGMLELAAECRAAAAKLDFATDPEGYEKAEQLAAMEIACEAVMLLARRHADLASERARSEQDPHRRRELEEIAGVCRRVPAYAPETFREALQAYWFCHLGVVGELNGWDALSPGHLDQHLLPFYRRDLARGILTPGSARELLEAFCVKFNNHPAPPKVGVTAAESGTYADFANLNLGGLLADGSDGSNEVSELLLSVLEDLHLLQPSSNVQISVRTPEGFLRQALRVVRRGYGFPSVFNADAVVAEQLRQGKSLEDARAGGCSGCVEVGAFGKEAYILTGYFNLVKTLELALHDGCDPRSGRRLGPATGGAGDLAGFEAVFAAFSTQLRHLLEIKIRGNQLIERIYAREMPAPFLSVLIDDCIARGRDYNAGGARYNNTYIQFVGLGSLTDCLAALRHHLDGRFTLPDLVRRLGADFAGDEPFRRLLLERSPKYGNDEEAADELMVRTFELLFGLVDGRPNTKGGAYRVEMLPTTCHIYFGAVTGAMPDGRKAGRPLSEGISPVQGADRRGPTAVLRSAAKMDQVKTGGTLLNMKFSPRLLEGEEGIARLAALVRGYFKLGGHHLQFNVVRAETLRAAQTVPEEHRDLLVRVAGYSDYFCDLSRELQEEIIARTEHDAFGSAEG